MKQGLTQKQAIKISLQQIQLMKLIELPTEEFEQRLDNELLDNPSLEIETDDQNSVEDNKNEREEADAATEEYDDVANDEFDLSEFESFTSDDEISEYKFQTESSSEGYYDKSPGEVIINHLTASQLNFKDYVKKELLILDVGEEDEVLIENIIGNIDEAGYIRRTAQQILNDIQFNYNLTFTVEKFEFYRNKIMDIDGLGLGSFDLREMLLKQIERKKEEPIKKIATTTIKDYFQYISKNKFEVLREKLNVSNEVVKEVVEYIAKLNPKPGLVFENEIFGVKSQTIIPDYLLDINKDEITIQLNNMHSPTLRVSSNYKSYLEKVTNKTEKINDNEKVTLKYMKSKIDAANWFIEAIRVRQVTLLRTMQVLTEIQKQFFLTGDEFNLKPMVLKDVAQKVGMDISTISRVVNSKYVQTPFGIYFLKNLFSESIKKTDGTEVSSIEVKAVIKRIIATENKNTPINDETLSNELHKIGYMIARRTVSKYREQLNIPSSRIRKEI